MHTLHRVTNAAVIAVGIAAAIAPGVAQAQQEYPTKPIRLIVGFPPGSQMDIIARLLGQRFAEAWGKPVVIDNVSGAAGTISADRVAKAASDGYTLGLLNQAQLAINPSLHKLAYDPVKDFAPVSQVAVSTTMLVVHNAVPAKDLQELIKLAKARPGDLTFASAGSGSNAHLAAELFKSVAGLDIRHVPYKGVVAAMPDLLGGRITMTFSPVSAILPLVREGKLRALAVTSLRHSAAAPEVPTIAESGYPGFDFTAWQGLLAPAMTPATIIRKLHLETVRALALPNMRAKLADLGLEAVGNAPDEFAMLIKSEVPKWAKVIKEMGIKPD